MLKIFVTFFIILCFVSLSFPHENIGEGVWTKTEVIFDSVLIGKATTQILWSNEVWEWYRDNNLENYVNSEGVNYDEPVLPEISNRERYEFNTQGNTPHQDIIVENFLSAMPDWSECLVVITLWGVWPSNEDWPRFYSWRERNGSKYSVSEAPGHLFYKTDIPELKELLIQLFEFGWEGYLLLKSKESSVNIIVFISHDGWLEINSLK